MVSNELGQLIFTGVSGHTLTEDEFKFLESENIGGVILFSKNYENPAQLGELVNSIQKARQNYPLFIGVDHEGGRVQRFRDGFSLIPSAGEVVEHDSPKICYHITKIIAEELKACGINVNFSPVCDILSDKTSDAIGDRAYGRTPDDVSKYISSVIRGLQANGVLSCAKHFPGHGETSKDSHKDLPYINRSLDQLVEHEFIPFVKAIKSRCEFVMMGHLVVDGLDENLPATLSKKSYEYLRSEMRFSRIVVTDDMQMEALTKHYSYGEAATMAIAAGADMLLYRDMDVAKEALEALKNAEKTKELKHDELKEKYARIDNVKKNNLKDYNPVYIPDISSSVNTKVSQTFFEDLKS
jgi:beta-N-acetylhexosaminidase